MIAKIAVDAVLQDMHQGGRAMIMMIMMSYVAGDDDTYYEKAESERALLAWGENKPWALSESPALSQTAKDCSKHRSVRLRKACSMCMSQVCCDTAVWKLAKYEVWNQHVY